jgi:toxin-antitoxin system PIN domain toxin
VKIPDVNLLLYAVDAGSDRHEPARAWLEEVLSGAEEVGFAWVALLGFLRITTNSALFEDPLSAEEAFAYAEEWLARPVSSLLAPGPGHIGLMRQLLEPLGTAANLTSDAHLAGLAIEHGADLCSSDTDFARFAGLRWIDPLR